MSSKGAAKARRNDLVGVLAIDERMTKAALVKELKTAQRWLRSLRGKLRAASENLIASRADAARQADERGDWKPALASQEALSALEGALLQLEAGAGKKLIRVIAVRIPTGRDATERLTIDLVASGDDLVWDGRIPALGYVGYLDRADTLYPFLLRDGAMCFGESYPEEPLLDLRGRSLKVGSTIPYFADGVHDGEGVDYFKVERVVRLFEA